MLSSVPLVRYRRSITLLRHADKHIIHIMKVYIERNKMQLEVISYSKTVDFIHVLAYSLRSDGFNAISPTERTSGSFEHNHFGHCHNLNRTLIIYYSLRFIQSRPTRDRESMHG